MVLQKGLQHEWCACKLNLQDQMSMKEWHNGKNGVANWICKMNGVLANGFCKTNRFDNLSKNTQNDQN